jgi:hypothetical protein
LTLSALDAPAAWGISGDPAPSAARALALRQSRQIVAGFEPNEKPLNLFPHCGQIAM